jgi:hypothetical protein
VRELSAALVPAQVLACLALRALLWLICFCFLVTCKTAIGILLGHHLEVPLLLMSLLFGRRQLVLAHFFDDLKTVLPLQLLLLQAGPVVLLKLVHVLLRDVVALARLPLRGDGVLATPLLVQHHVIVQCAGGREQIHLRMASLLVCTPSVLLRHALVIGVMLPAVITQDQLLLLGCRIPKPLTWIA